MKAVCRMLVVAAILVGGLLCPPALMETLHAESAEAADDCGPCADWIGCGCCAVRAVVASPEKTVVSLVVAVVPPLQVNAPATPSLVEVFHPPRA